MNIANVKIFPAPIKDSSLLSLFDMTKQGLVRGSPHHQHCVTFLELDRICKLFPLQVVWLEVIEEVESVDIH